MPTSSKRLAIAPTTIPFYFLFFCWVTFFLVLMFNFYVRLELQGMLLLLNQQLGSWKLSLKKQSEIFRKLEKKTS